MCAYSAPKCATDRLKQMFNKYTLALLVKLTRYFFHVVHTFFDKTVTKTSPVVGIKL